MNLVALLQFLAGICCALFAGAALYVNLVEHPARMACGTELAATVFPVSYRKGTVMQATLALVGFAFAVAAWLAGAGIWWLVGGLLLGAVVPFTLIVIMPTNRRLESPTLDKRAPATHQLLVRWNKLHAVRTVLAGLALIVFLVQR